MSSAPWVSFCGPKYMTAERSGPSAPESQARLSTAASKAAACGCSVSARPNSSALRSAAFKRWAAAAIESKATPVSCSTRSGLHAASDRVSSASPSAGSSAGDPRSKVARASPCSRATSAWGR